MTHPDAGHHAHDTHGHAAAVANPFTPEEQAALHEDDLKAGRNIVILMLGIFLTGLLLYTVVTYVVHQGRIANETGFVPDPHSLKQN